MSNLIAGSEVLDSKECETASTKPILEKLAIRIAHIGENITIRRALPNRERRRYTRL